MVCLCARVCVRQTTNRTVAKRWWIVKVDRLAPRRRAFGIRDARIIVVIVVVVSGPIHFNVERTSYSQNIVVHLAFSFFLLFVIFYNRKHCSMTQNFHRRNCKVLLNIVEVVLATIRHTKQKTKNQSVNVYVINRETTTTYLR